MPYRHQLINELNIENAHQIKWGDGFSRASSSEFIALCQPW